MSERKWHNFIIKSKQKLKFEEKYRVTKESSLCLQMADKFLAIHAQIFIILAL